MKLGALRAAIRAEKNVSVNVFGIDVLVQKTQLLAALGEHFTGGKAQETGLVLTDGILGAEDGQDESESAGDWDAALATPPLSAPAPDPLDDLL